MDVQRAATAIKHWVIGNVAWMAATKLVVAAAAAVTVAASAVAERFPYPVVVVVALLAFATTVWAVNGLLALWQRKKPSTLRPTNEIESADALAAAILKALEGRTPRTEPDLAAALGVRLERLEAAIAQLQAGNKVEFVGDEVRLVTGDGDFRAAAARFGGMGNVPEVGGAPPVDPGPDLPNRELTDEETAFLFGPTDRPHEPITAGLGRPVDPELSRAIGRGRKAANAIRDLLDEMRFPPLDVIRDTHKGALWRLEQEQAQLGRYMSKLHGHVLVAVDGLRPYVTHEQLDQLYRTPKHTGDLRRIAELLDVVADMAIPQRGVDDA